MSTFEGALKWKLPYRVWQLKLHIRTIEVLNVCRTVTTLRITGRLLRNGQLLCAEQEFLL